MRGRVRIWLLLLAILPVLPLAGQDIFWERPQVFPDQQVRFSSSFAGDGRMAVAWEEIVPQTGGSGAIYLSLGMSTDGQSWTWHRRFFGPVQYSGLEPGSEPLVYSMVIDREGRILVAVTSAEREVTVLASSDSALTFVPVAHISSQQSIVAPSLFLTDGGRFLLFATQAAGNRTSLSLAWSSSPDGLSWTTFSPFVAPGEPGDGIQLQPDHVSSHGREVVVFQSQKPGTDNYQVFLKESLDGGETWLPARAVTGLPGFAEKVGDTEYKPENFTNQRPRIAVVGDALGLAWERALEGRATSNLYYCELDQNGTVTTPVAPVDPDRRNAFCPGHSLCIPRVSPVRAERRGRLSSDPLGEGQRLEPGGPRPWACPEAHSSPTRSCSRGPCTFSGKSRGHRHHSSFPFVRRRRLHPQLSSPWVSSPAPRSAPTLQRSAGNSRMTRWA